MPYKSDEGLYHLNESSRDHYRHAAPQAREAMRRSRIPLGDEPDTGFRRQGAARTTNNGSTGTNNSSTGINNDSIGTNNSSIGTNNGSTRTNNGSTSTNHASTARNANTANTTYTTKNTYITKTSRTTTAKPHKPLSKQDIKTHQEKIRQEALKRMNHGGKQYQGQNPTGQSPRRQPNTEGKKKTSPLTRIIWLLILLWLIVPTALSAFKEKIAQTTTNQETTDQDSGLFGDTEELEQWETSAGSGHMTYLMYADRKSKAEVGNDIKPDTYIFCTTDEKVTLTVEQKSTGKTLEYTLKKNDTDSPTLELKTGDLLYVSGYDTPYDSVTIIGWDQ